MAGGKSAFSSTGIDVTASEGSCLVLLFCVVVVIVVGVGVGVVVGVVVD